MINDEEFVPGSKWIVEDRKGNRHVFPYKRRNFYEQSIIVLEGYGREFQFKIHGCEFVYKTPLYEKPFVIISKFKGKQQKSKKPKTNTLW